MSTPNAQELTKKAADAAGFLVGDLRDLAKRAAEDNPLLHMLVMDLIEDAAKIEQRLAMIDTVHKETDNHTQTHTEVTPYHK